MSKKILVLDDDNDILELISFILLENRYDVKTFSCGEHIFATIEDFQPDLILMDVMLAGMDGRLICRRIKENQLTSMLPVILISGTHDLAESLHLPGAPDDFVAKPFDIDHLLYKIKVQLSAA
jgi:DNA-binding response OmpR family regulator